MFQTRRDLVYIILAGFFITNAIVAEMIGGKLIQVGPFVMSIGIVPWPVVFLTTDLINEHYGKKGVRKLSFLTAGLISYMLLILFIGVHLTAVSFSPVKDSAFYEVFGQVQWIIVASIIAFVVSQIVDVSIFWIFRNATNGKMIWLRATGSTAVSQLIDTFLVAGIAFWLPGKITFGQYVNMAGTGYVFKLIVAVALTPFIYIGHNLINKYLEKDKK
jgi:hypothetical protein